jgi:RHS repeat-associated protein
MRFLLLAAVLLVSSAAQAQATLSASPGAIMAGGTINAIWNNVSPPSSSHWVGMFTPTAPNSGYLAWRFITNDTSGSVPFPTSTSTILGTYQLRLFASGTGALLATSNNFIVGRGIAGSVTLNGAPLAGVAFSATSGGSCTSSDASGQYTCVVSNAWSGTVTPTPTSYTFTPASRSYASVTMNQTAQNYSAAPFKQISGTVSFNGLPLPNVGFSTGGAGSCTTSNAGGQYTCSVPTGWSGSITPSATGYAFTPSSKSYTSIAADDPGEDYTATLSNPTSNILFVHVDHLNTPRLVSDSTGTAVWKWDQQEPFGVSPPDKNPSALGVFDFPLRHPGQYDDPETGLFYNYFRDCYDPVLGRYCQSDPIGLRGGINTYAYVGSNPMLRIDPTGEQAVALPAPAPIAGGLALPIVAAAGAGLAGWQIGSALYPYIALPLGNALDACFANSPAVPPDRINRCKEAFKWCLGDASIPEAKCFEAYNSCVKTNNPFIFPGYGVVK